MAWGHKYTITGERDSSAAFGKCKVTKEGDENWSAEADFMDNKYHGLGMYSLSKYNSV